MAATNNYVDVSKGKLTFGTYAAENFRNLISQQPLGLAMKNSFVYAITVTVICLFICSLAGYGFEVYHDKWKDKLFSVLLLAMMVPQVATMIPLFRMFSKAGLLNTVLAFFLPMISTPFMIMMFRQNSRAFPVDIVEAARIDGLSEIKIFFQMYMPVMKSTYAAAAGTVITAGWSNSAGNWVVISHGNGLVTKYMHHSSICVSAGQRVEKGQQIGYVGSTGYSTGAHLHFQVELNGTPVNPNNYM